MILLNIPYANAIKKESAQTGRKVYDIVKDALDLYFDRTETSNSKVAKSTKSSKSILDLMRDVHIENPISVTWTREELNERR